MKHRWILLVFTDIRFVNRSLNTNVRSVAIFGGRAPNAGDRGAIDPPRIWHLIEACPYLWSHPVRLGWDPLCQFFDADQKLISAHDLSRLEARPSAQKALGMALARDIVEGQEVLRVVKTDAQGVHRVRLLRAGKPVADKLLAVPGAAAAFALFGRLSYCADMRLTVGAPVSEASLNASLTTLDLTGLRSLTVFMIGGDPGPMAPPLRFVAADRRKW